MAKYIALLDSHNSVLYIEVYYMWCVPYMEVSLYFNKVSTVMLNSQDGL